ncbi:hypothetical protein P6166_16995 [Stenotrophomonas sp. HITSZ_GD]|uniref:hypothetical protein n=1 Tax=Stenotrophomonas sp. HITSZ_GD TaxID=3037248 RepID=UPI00240E1878|nr:hypothetical protein [Stenotrophomonas sp. HITSZ_GD]MDG2527052.1 hypothetical protein [Stenotrophomonas sp. HITSZ_GD]
MQRHVSSKMQAPDPRVLRVVRQVALAGLALVLVWPAARGHSQWLGWGPLWLLGMPMTAWWALYRFRLPRWRAARTGTGRVARRGPQARRRAATRRAGQGVPARAA